MNNEFKPGTVHPEVDYLELERLSTKLGIPVPMMFVTVEATNPDGTPGERYHDRARTWNRNYWNWLWTLFGALSSSSASSITSITGDSTFGAGHINLKGLTGTIATTALSNCMAFPPENAFIPAVNVVLGIVVGTGTTAESFENGSLVSACAQGTGVGQLNYLAGVFTQPTYNAGTRVWTSAQSRVITNNSSATIVVAETGLYPTSFAAVGYMVERSLLGATISVLAAGQLTVTYTMTLTFPA